MNLSKAKILWLALLVFGVLLASFLGYLSYQRGFFSGNDPSQSVTKITAKNEVTSDIQLPAEEPIVTDSQSASGSESENFKIEQIRFGGDTNILIDDSEKLPLEVYDVRSETFANRKGDEAKVVLTWKSNKLALCEVEYAKSDGQNPKSVKETNYGFNHSMVLQSLDPATSYYYKIKSVDRWGNANESEYFGVYTGSKAVSVFELIGKTMSEIFGWAIK